MKRTTQYPEILVDTMAATVVRVSETQLVALRVELDGDDTELPDPQELMIGSGLNFGPFALEDVDDLEIERYLSVAIKEDA